MRQLKESLFMCTFCFQQTLSRPCWALVKRKLIIIGSNVTVGAPREHQLHVWVCSGKCLGLITGVSFACLTPSLCSLCFALPPSFVSFAQVFFRPRSQFHSLRLSFWKGLLCRLTTTSSRPLLNW